MSAAEFEHDEIVTGAPCPGDIWGPTLRAAGEGCELTADQIKALELRELCLVVADSICKLTDDPEIKTNAFIEGDVILTLHQGMRALRVSGIAPNAHAQRDELDTPLILAEYTAGQLLRVDVNNLPNIHQDGGEKQVDFAALTYYYLCDAKSDEEPEREEETMLSGDELLENSQDLWDEIVAVVLRDPELRYQAAENYMGQITDPDPRLGKDDGLELTKDFPKTDGTGKYTLSVSVLFGAELIDWGERGEFLGSAFVMGPGKSQAFIGYSKDRSPNGDYSNSDVALREAKRIITAFVANLDSGSGVSDE